MHQRFDQQFSLGIQPISEVALPLKSRDELPPILRGLQYIFTTPSLNEKVFELLEEKICKGKKKTGRKGIVCPALCGGPVACFGIGRDPPWSEHKLGQVGTDGQPRYPYPQVVAHCRKAALSLQIFLYVYL